MSIKQKAAELADHLAGIKTELSEMPFKADVVLFLRQIAGLCGDLPVPVAQVLTVQQHQSVILKEPVIWIGQRPYGESLYTGKQLGAARLAGFEAGRRKGLEDAASVCEKISNKYNHLEGGRPHHTRTCAESGAYECGSSILALINKEA